MFYWLTWFATKIVSFFFFPIKVEGRENIPKQGAFLLASNHSSNLDPVVIPICTTRRLSFFAKDSLFKNPVLGWILRHLDSFPVKRGTADIAAVKELIRRLKDDRPVVVFPSGTRVRPGKALQVQSGIGMVLAKVNVPVLPVFVSGTSEVMPPGAKRLKRHLVRVRFGTPFYPPTNIRSHQERAQMVMQRILALGNK